MKKFASVGFAFVALIVLFQNVGIVGNVPSTVPRISVRTDPSRAEAREGGSPAAVILSRFGGDLSTDLLVHLELSGDAVRDRDYTISGATVGTDASGSSVILPAGAESLEILVTALPDFDYEPRERLTIRLQPGADYTLEGPGQRAASVRLPRDEVAPQTFLMVANPVRQFTSNETSYIAKNYKYVVLEKVHAGGDYEKRDLDANAIKRKNPDIKLFAYIAMSVRFHYNTFGRDGHSPVFENQWYFKDDVGQDLQYMGSDANPAQRKNKRHLYVDLRQPDYRKWVRRTIARWQQGSNRAWSGVFFDNSSLISANEEKRPSGLKSIFSYVDGLLSDVLPIPAQMSRDSVRAWNDGLIAMLDEAHFGPQDQVIRDKNGDPFLVAFNGIADREVSPNRNQRVLLESHTDIAFNERFCFHASGSEGHYQSRSELEAEFELMRSAAQAGKVIWQVSKMKDWQHPEMPTEEEVNTLGSYCYGAFLMAYLPGFHLFKFGGSSYSNPDHPEQFRWDEIRINAKEISLRLGRPKGARRSADGVVWSRTFENGVVYVNPSGGARSISLERRARLVSNGVPGEVSPRGATLPIDARTARFFLFEKN